MIVRIFYLLAFTLIFSSCHGQKNIKTEEKDTTPRSFEMVTVPSMITDPDERAKYLVQHYWDKFDFTDTAYIHLPDITEQALTNYIDLMKYVSQEVASSSIKGMMHKATADSTFFAHMADLYEKYLYDPNSPMRDESLYIPVLEAILAAPILDDVSKIRPAHLLELALKNRVGEPATNFTYTLADGRTGTLYNVKADYLVLFFYNPDCHACQEITGQLSSSPLIGQLETTKLLKILAVYPDEDLEAWRNHIPDVPLSWINSYDHTVALKNDEIYDLKAIPTIYLLDKDKKVLLKDVTFNQLEEYLQMQTN